MIKYIIVQAGGKGTRLDYLTTNKPKALVSIGTKPILFTLFDFFPDSFFIIISDYKIEVLHKYLEHYAKVKFIIVDTHGMKGTISGIKKAIDYVPDFTQFMIIWSDLVLSQKLDLNLSLERDYIGISKDFMCRWKYENNEFIEKKSDDKGVAGLFIFKNKKELANIPYQGEFVRWLSSEKLTFEEIPLYKTKEYGTLNMFQNNNNEFKTRPFNKIVVKENRIFKFAIGELGEKLSIDEINWYKVVSGYNYKGIPKIYSYTPLEMDLIKSNKLYDGNFDEDKKRIILKNIVSQIKKLHELEVHQTNYFDIFETYYYKTFRRLNTVISMIPNAYNEYITINNIKCKNVLYLKKEILNQLEVYLQDSFNIIHGDITFSNILMTKNEQPKFIDPRGYFGHSKFIGDRNYDWAKLYYSLKGNYDQFNLGNFKLIFNDDNSVCVDVKSNQWEFLEDDFFKLLGDNISKFHIKLIHSLIWLSLTTYVWDNYDSICAAFYLGTYYLNNCFKEENII